MNQDNATKKDIEKIVGKAIEDFAQIVNQGFSEQTKFINEKFDVMENKFNAKIDSVENKLNTKIDSVENKLNTKIDSVENKLNTRIDEIISGNDNIAKEISDMRTEQSAIIGGRQRVNDTLLDYKDRIKKLEMHTKIKQAEVIA